VKVLAPIDFKEPTAKERFEKEVSLTKDFDHPNLVKVFDFGVADTGQQFVVMELVNGGALSARIYDADNPLSFAESLFILRDVARGVGVAHAQGVVHRDLKPDNILITREGNAKVADFGLAREMAAGTTITQSAETVGTPYYMSPEQFRNHRVDHRADIYSLGIIAFEMIAKRRPYFSEAYLELAHLHAREPLPSFHERSGVPKWFETFAIVCSEKTPELRYQSMEEVASYLERRMARAGIVDGHKGPWHLRAISMALGEG
jgi:serine/threonine-protein kinase